MDTDARPGFDALAHVEKRGDAVRVEVPPSSDFLRTVRLVAADAAVRAGGDLDEVEDFRIAVDELCHLLMTLTDHSVHVTFTTHAGHVVGRGNARARNGRAAIALHEVSAMIVDATADRYRIERRGSDVTFEVAKRARHPQDHHVSGRIASRP